MNRKTIFGVIVSTIFLLGACTPPATPLPLANTSVPESNPSTTATSVEETSITEAAEPEMDPSLACAGGNMAASPTVSLTEGPYYTPNTPERTSLYEEGMAGTKLTLTGYVFDTNCNPVANAWLDFWQAGADGEYDNAGFTLRGHQYTDSTGRFELITVIPGIYPGRTEHIHFKVQARNGQVITSQLFFPGVAQNESDSIFDESLLLPIQESSDGLLAQYNFIVPAQ